MSKNFLKVLGVSAAVALSALTVAQQMERVPAAVGAQVYIVSPVDGAVVPATFDVVFGLQGMGVAPAGIQANNTGHHHLLVDVAQQPDLNMPLGADVTHFGAGQTQTTLTLTPGEHTLQLILGDHMHIPHNPPVVSEQITITVR